MTVRAESNAVTSSLRGSDSYTRGAQLAGTGFSEPNLNVIAPYCVQVKVPSTDDAIRNSWLQLCAMAETRTASEASALSASVSAVLASAYELEKWDCSRAAAKRLMLFVETNARTNQLAAANKLLGELDAQKLSGRALSGVVRATARMQNFLPAWGGTYLKAWDAICKKGKDPHVMFVGMKEPTERKVASKSK